MPVEMILQWPGHNNSTNSHTSALGQPPPHQAAVQVNWQHCHILSVNIIVQRWLVLCSAAACLAASRRDSTVQLAEPTLLAWRCHGLEAWNPPAKPPTEAHRLLRPYLQPGSSAQIPGCCPGMQQGLDALQKASNSLPLCTPDRCVAIASSDRGSWRFLCLLSRKQGQ